MKRAHWFLALCVGCGTSTDPPGPPASAALCDAEKTWLARCPSANDCARVAVSACARVAPQVSAGYTAAAVDAFRAAKCDGFDAAQFARSTAAPGEEQIKIATAFCKECRPGVADCAARFFTGDDLGTGTAALVTIMSDANVHELNNRWPTMADAGSCAATFQQVVVRMFTERVAIAHCP